MLDEIDARFLDDLHRAWAERPPLRHLAAAYFGYRPKGGAASRDYQALLAMFPGGAIR